MGKTSKPVHILVTDESMLTWPEIIALKEQGHDIDSVNIPNGQIHYIGPNCWRTLDAEYLDVTLTAIRKEVYESTKPTRTDTDRQPVTKRNPRKPKRQVAISPARSQERSGDSVQHDGGVV